MNFDGKASNLVKSTKKSAARLVALITSHFPGFRDHTMYKGHQVFLYKRAQIFVADLWGAFKGQDYGEFDDIGSITMFANYIVPAVLQQLGVLKYSPTLSNLVDSKSEICSGSEEEVKLRACCVHVVEKIRDLVTKISLICNLQYNVLEGRSHLTPFNLSHELYSYFRLRNL